MLLAFTTKFKYSYEIWHGGENQPSVPPCDAQLAHGDLAPIGGATGKWRLPGEGTHSPLGVWPWKVASVPVDVHRPMCTWEGLIGLVLLITKLKNYYRTRSWVGVTAQGSQEVGDWTNTHSKNKKNIKTKQNTLAGVNAVLIQTRIQRSTTEWSSISQRTSYICL